MVAETVWVGVIDADAVIEGLCVAEMEIDLVGVTDGLDVGLGFLEGDAELLGGGDRDGQGDCEMDDGGQETETKNQSLRGF